MSIEIHGLCPLLQVFDMPTSIRFYRDLLGFQMAGASEALSDNPDDVNWSWLKFNEAAVMLNTAYEPEYRPAEPEQARFAGHGDTCLYLGCPDVDAAYRYLRGKGLDIQEPKVALYGMKQLYITDPDQYCICFQWTA
jgi:catechol 2,3-dioxygenase-like lactoylglutathione lyase family enzyme